MEKPIIERTNAADRSIRKLTGLSPYAGLGAGGMLVGIEALESLIALARRPVESAEVSKTRKKDG